MEKSDRKVGTDMNEMMVLILGVAVALLVVAVAVLAKRRPAGGGTPELDRQLRALSEAVSDTVGRVSQANMASVELLRGDVERQLGQIRHTVEGKLDDTLKSGLDASFRRVSDQLSQVYQSMGEVRSLTEDIGALKQILSNVKTRGLWGEVQLDRLLRDFLAPGQYVENARIEGAYVEFAVRLPGGEGQLLPIDSKFPMDRYARVLKAADAGDTQKWKDAQKEMVAAVLLEAKKINEKYIRPPQTTDFAVMFLPSEGLYCEVIRLGLLEQLQSKWRVMVTGPSTLGALLTSLQTGFKTLAVQEHSAAIMELLLAVRLEFESFAAALQKTQNSLNAAQNHLDTAARRASKISGRLADADRG